MKVINTGASASASAEGYPPSADDELLSLDLMAWLDNFDWVQEPLLNYS